MDSIWTDDQLFDLTFNISGENCYDSVINRNQKKY